MNELKLLIELVATLPAMAIWVLVGFYAYKVVVIGSIYGLLRFLIDKTHSWLTAPKVTELKLGGMTLNEDVAGALVGQLHRLRSTTYIHASDVEKLKKAIDHIQTEERKK